MRRKLAVAFGTAGLVLLVAAAAIWFSADPDCPAQGAYGNYCGIREWAVSWTLAGIAAVALAVAAWLAWTGRPRAA